MQTVQPAEAVAQQDQIPPSIEVLFEQRVLPVLSNILEGLEHLKPEDKDK